MLTERLLSKFADLPSVGFYLKTHENVATYWQRTNFLLIIGKITETSSLPICVFYVFVCHCPKLYRLQLVVSTLNQSQSA